MKYGTLKAERLPTDPLKDLSQALTFSRIGIFNEGDAARQMSFKGRMLLTILTLGAMMAAVREDRFEAVEISTRRLDTPVYDQAGKMLLNALAHDARLAMVDLKALFDQDGRCAG